MQEEVLISNWGRESYEWQCKSIARTGSLNFVFHLLDWAFCVEFLHKVLYILHFNANDVLLHVVECSSCWSECMACSLEQH